MFDYIKGKIIAKNTPYLVLETGGIGWNFLCNARTLNVLGNVGEEAKIYTKLIHKEDAMFLCGFAHREDRIIFDILTKVNGIGTKVAMVISDEFSGSELAGAVVAGDWKLISRAKGVGPKMAQKIVLELKDKLTDKTTSVDLVISEDNDTNISRNIIEEVQTILQSLGWGSNEYKDALKKALKMLKNNDSEELLRETLQILSRG